MSTSTQIICLGEILFDCLADPMGKELSEVTSWTEYPGGAPANVACALSKLGDASAFIGCVGQDKAGGQLISVLEENGVDVAGVQRATSAPTRKVYVTRSLGAIAASLDLASLTQASFLILSSPQPTSRSHFLQTLSF